MTEFTQDPVEKNLFRENEGKFDDNPNPFGVEQLPEVGGPEHIALLEEQVQDSPATGPGAPNPFKRDLIITVHNIGEPLRGKVVQMVENLLVGYGVEVSE